MATTKPLILIIDDDPGLVKLVRRDLEIEGYRTITASDGAAGIDMIQYRSPDLVLLDITMPGMDGFEVCRRVREFSAVPIVMLTARDELEHVVRGLKLGADDYVTKPFNVDELLARVKSVLRRAKFSEEMPQPPFEAGPLRIDFATHAVTMDGRDVTLTPNEYRVLCFLASHAGKVLTHDQILSEIWGWEYAGDSHLIQVAINRLRKKLGDNPRHPEFIATRSGIGYVFKKTADDAC